MANSEEDQIIKVVDKRRFSESGNSTSNADPTGVTKDSDVSAVGDVVTDPEPKNATPQKLDLSSFLMGVYHQTLIFLGEIPNPETNLVNKNMEAAKQNIDILDILEEKTKGNLSSDENGLLGEILNNLRLLFVKKV